MPPAAPTYPATRDMMCCCRCPQLRDLLLGMGDLNMSLGEAILASHRIDRANQLDLLKGDFLGQVLETTDAVTRALHWRPLTNEIAKLAENAQRAKEFAAVPAAFCLTTGCEADGGVTADGVTADCVTAAGVTAAGVTAGGVTTSVVTAKTSVTAGGATADCVAAGPRSLLEPRDDATAAARALKDLAVAEDNGMESFRVDAALKELWESRRLAEASVMAAWRALVIIDDYPNPEKVLEIKDPEEQPDWPIKQAKIAARDVFVWRCIGLVLGMDSKAALGPFFNTFGPGQTRAQLLTAFKKIREATVQLLPAKIRDDMGTHARRPRVRKDEPGVARDPNVCPCHPGAPPGITRDPDVCPPPGLTLGERRPTLANILPLHSSSLDALAAWQ